MNAVLVTAVFATLTSTRHGLFDLRVYYGAVNYWVHDHGMIYDFGLSVSHYGFTYPPFAAMVMLPMAVLNLPATMPEHSSALYARNVQALLELFLDEEGNLNLDWDDEVIAGACVTKDQS